MFAVHHLTDGGKRKPYNIQRIEPYVAAIDHTAREKGVESPIDYQTRKWLLGDLRAAAERAADFTHPLRKALIVKLLRSLDETSLNQHWRKIAYGLLWHLGCGPTSALAICGGDMRELPQGVAVTWTPTHTTMATQPITVVIPFGADSEICIARSLLHWKKRLKIGTSSPILLALCGTDKVRKSLRSPKPVVVSVRLRDDLVNAGVPKDEARKYTAESFRAGHLVCAMEAGISHHKIAARMGYSSVENMLRRAKRLPIWYPDHEIDTVL